MTNLKSILINKISCKSIWFMRQAGRYLPEFREIRKKNKDFIKLCLNSNLSSEITLQPIKRYNLDSAIIFSDILMTPYALGQNITFIKEEGPRLSEFKIEVLTKNNKEKFTQKLKSVYEAIKITRKRLEKNKSLICFIGAPWTLLVYMLGLKTEDNKLNLDKYKKYRTQINQILLELNDYLCVHIKNQINAGADVVQIFDSWAGLIPIKDIKDFCYIPNKRIIDFCKSKEIATICFPKGLKDHYKDFNDFVKPDGINLDPELDPIWARNNLKDAVLQGGLDPKILFKTDEEILEVATKYIKTFKDIPYVFNLGHGLLPETDPDKVKMLVNFYRNYNE